VVAGNNRPLGRSAAAVSSLDECVAAATRLHRDVGHADSSVLFSVADGHWGWTVALDGEPVAVSVHAYERRFECVRSLEQFLVAVAHAEPAPERVRRLGPTTPRGLDGPDVLTIALRVVGAG
jgi:hypothetical protein